MKKLSWILLILTISTFSQTPGNGVTDIDGNIYNSVIIGTQEWMKENLNVSKYSDGTVIPQVTDPTAWTNLTTGAWCYYSNTSSNSTTYGKLYNWYAVAGIYDSASLADASLRKQIGVYGWHVPSETEWRELINYIDPTANGGDIYPNSVGGKLKEVGTLHWASPNIEATNTSGFTAIPGGFRGNDGPFYNIGGHGNWWSSTAATDTTNAFDIILKHDSGSVIKNAYIRSYGFSVRLLKNTTPNDQSSSFCTSLSGSLASGLVGYWPFCGNTNDDSGNGNNGTNNGATLTTDRFGNSNSAYNFDGTSNYIQLPKITSLNDAPSFTFSCWILPTGSTGTRQFVLSRGYDYATGSFFISQESESNSDYVRFSYNGYPNYNILSPQGYSIPYQNWQLLTVTKNSTTVNLYINSILVNSSTNTTNLLAKDEFLYIGSHWFDNQNGGFFPYYFNGKIDDVGIYNRALTQQEITSLYNQNQCVNNITVTDTLIINVGQLSFNDPVAWANNITIAPNPASNQININFNTITDLNGGTIKIINSLGQQVATTPITLSGTNTTMPLTTWGGTGLYFVQILNAQGIVVDVKKIILQ